LKNGGTSVYRTQAVENEIFNSLLRRQADSPGSRLKLHEYKKEDEGKS
jgi:hypothetical protein